MHACNVQFQRILPCTSMRTMRTVERLLSWVSHKMACQLLLPGRAWLELFTTHSTTTLPIQTGKQGPNIQSAASLLQHKPPLSVPPSLSPGLLCIEYFYYSKIKKFVNSFFKNHCIHRTVPTISFFLTYPNISYDLPTFYNTLIITSQSYIGGREGYFIRMHNSAMSLDGIFPTTTVCAVWTTIWLYSCVDEEMAL